MMKTCNSSKCLMCKLTKLKPFKEFLSSQYMQYINCNPGILFECGIYNLTKHINGVMVSVLASSGVDPGFHRLSHVRVKPKTIKLVFAASLLITQH